MNEDFDLGRLLGRREAFSTVAARCSAAEAVALQQIRENRAYLNHAQDWEEFCAKFLHASKDSVNRVIRYLEEFGPSYFDVAQLTRISPKAYRAIAPAIREQSLHHNGEAIALIPENAEKVAAAVAELRKAAAPAPERRPESPADVILPLEKSATELTERIEQVVALRRYPEPMRALIGYMKARLDRIALGL